MATDHLMRRGKVEHILRAAGRITGQKTFVLIGSAAIVAWREVVPDALIISRDIDLFAYDSTDAERISEELEGSLGHASDFDNTFGFYCDGVGPETAILPTDWEERAKKFSNANTEGVVAIVPEPNDIALAKLCASRPKDIEWLRAAKAHMIIDVPTMRARLSKLPPRAGDLAQLAARLDGL
jgi:hypothetical protein